MMILSGIKEDIPNLLLIVILFYFKYNKKEITFYRKGKL